MFELGKFLSSNIRTKLIKFNLIRRLIIWKNRNIHPNDTYSIINFTRKFDINYYKTNNPELDYTKTDPIEHYIDYGVKGCADPAIWFCTEKYVEKYKEFLSINTNPFYHHLLNPNKFPAIPTDKSYSTWFNKFRCGNDSDIRKIENFSNSLIINPLISILLFINENDDVLLFKRFISSVLNQVYNKWELIVCLDPNFSVVIRDVCRKSKVISYTTLIEIEGYGNRIEKGIKASKGEWLVIINPQDVLHPDSLLLLTHYINEYKESKFFYSDGGNIDTGGHLHKPSFKTQWNETLFFNDNYLLHLNAYKTGIIKKIKNFYEKDYFIGNYYLLVQYFTLINWENIVHIPFILHHSGKEYNSNNYSDLISHVQRDIIKNKKIFAEVVLDKGISILKFKVKNNPKVSIIIPFRDKIELLSQCIQGLSQTDYTNFEIILVNNNSIEKATFDFLSSLEKDMENIKIINCPGDFNYSLLNNTGVKSSTGEYLLFLNNDIEFVNNNWLKLMVAHIQRDEVGIVGARLLYPDGTIQHDGVVLGIGGVAGHIFRGLNPDYESYMHNSKFSREISAVTAAAMLTKKKSFEEIGGFNENNLKVAYNDIDLCIRMGLKGYKIILATDVVLIHHESKSRGSDFDPEKIERYMNEVEYMKTRWEHILYYDPFFNHNLSLTSELVELSWPPRILVPWNRASNE